MWRGVGTTGFGGWVLGGNAEITRESSNSSLNESY